MEPTHSAYPSVGLVRSTFPHGEIKGHELGAEAQLCRAELGLGWKKKNVLPSQKLALFAGTNAFSFNVRFPANSQRSEMLPVALTSVP